ncbi:MAG: hypothetical protein A2340_14205 [Lentisphaerae bacterium RIFOXYB12_FULL_60_10]|nr:MAG: hypothetical protein A2340_14205 [Lentisphaerae bacterium RIFOXYB12_FULL_60_10]
MSDHPAMTPAVANEYFVFRKRLPLQLAFEAVSREIGRVDPDHVCLEIGALNPVLSYRLRKLGGQWHTVLLNESEQPAFQELLGGNVYVSKDGKLPFKKKIFDRVVIWDVLDTFRDEEAFIEDVHGLLRPDGQLIIHVNRLKRGSLINTLRDLLGFSPEETGRFRAGYTESDLFRVLKHGFDVHAMRSYSRFLVEFVDVWVRFAVRRQGGEGPVSEGSVARIQRVYRLAAFFYWLAYQVDVFLFFNKGFRLVASAKRRAWRPRNAPILVDGRSISEAVLSRAED